MFYGLIFLFFFSPKRWERVNYVLRHTLCVTFQRATEIWFRYIHIKHSVNQRHKAWILFVVVLQCDFWTSPFTFVVLFLYLWNNRRIHLILLRFLPVPIITICVNPQYSIWGAQDMGQKHSQERTYPALRACCQDKPASVGSQTLNGLASCLG